MDERAFKLPSIEEPSVVWPYRTTRRDGNRGQPLNRFMFNAMKASVLVVGLALTPTHSGQGLAASDFLDAPRSVQASLARRQNAESLEANRSLTAIAGLALMVMIAQRRLKHVRSSRRP